MLPAVQRAHISFAKVPRGLFCAPRCDIEPQLFQTMIGKGRVTRAVQT